MANKIKMKNMNISTFRKSGSDYIMATTCIRRPISKYIVASKRSLLGIEFTVFRGLKTLKTLRAFNLTEPRSNSRILFLEN